MGKTKFKISMKYGLRIDVSDPKGDTYDGYIAYAKEKAAGVILKTPQNVEASMPEFSEALQITMYTAALLYSVDISVSVEAGDMEEAVETAKALVFGIDIQTPWDAMHHGLEYDYTSYVEASYGTIQVGMPEKDVKKRAEQFLKPLSPEEKDAVYRRILFERVEADIKSRLSDTGETLAGWQVERAASRYAYDGACDRTQSYWDNLDALINEANLEGIYDSSHLFK